MDLCVKTAVLPPQRQNLLLCELALLQTVQIIKSDTYLMISITSCGVDKGTANTTVQEHCIIYHKTLKLN